MDQVTALHGEERVFIGSVPEKMIDCHKQIYLMLGILGHMFALNRRVGGVAHLRCGPRSLGNSFPIDELFRQGLAQDVSIDLTIHNIEESMNEQAVHSALASNPKNRAMRGESKDSPRPTSFKNSQGIASHNPCMLLTFETTGADRF